MSKTTTLDSQTIAIVKETIPLLVQTGSKFTEHLYQRMFATTPDLKNVFNMNNQQNGDQPRALFQAIALYAENLENVDLMLPVVEKIAQKHVSFQVTPEQYSIVGSNILATIDELYHPGEKVLQAWASAYALLASIFVNREAEIYKEIASNPGGWIGTREFRIAQKVPQSASITSFEFEPVDAKPIAAYKPGQYLTVWLQPNEFVHREIRQFSLTRQANNRSYRIAVKREIEGVVSNWLHKKAQKGEVINIVAPLGDFYMEIEPNTPVTLISGGVGQTPLLAMLDTLSQAKHSAQVNWFHSAENGAAHAFSNEVKDLGSNLSHFKTHIWYSKPTQEDKVHSRFDSEGRISVNEREALYSASNTQYYICGPVEFMKNVVKQLLDLGIKSDDIHYEVFGPHKIL